MVASYFLPAEGCNFGIKRNVGGMEWTAGSAESNLGQGVVFLTLLITRDPGSRMGCLRLHCVAKSES